MNKSGDVTTQRLQDSIEQVLNGEEAASVSKEEGSP